MVMYNVASTWIFLKFFETFKFDFVKKFKKGLRGAHVPKRRTLLSMGILTVCIWTPFKTLNSLCVKTHIKILNNWKNSHVYMEFQTFYVHTQVFSSPSNHCGTSRSPCHVPPHWMTMSQHGNSHEQLLPKEPVLNHSRLYCLGFWISPSVSCV
jgi:hypothetical protein